MESGGHILYPFKVKVLKNVPNQAFHL
jgi:hypothetical protein